MRLGEMAEGSDLLLYTCVDQLKPVYGKTILRGSILQKTSECTVVVKMDDQAKILTNCVCEVTNKNDGHTYRFKCECVNADDGLIISSNNDCDWKNTRQELRYNIKIPCYISTDKCSSNARTNDVSLHGISINIDRRIKISVGDKCYVRINYSGIAGVSVIEIKYVKYIDDKMRIGGSIVENAHPMQQLVDDYISSHARF